MTDEVLISIAPEEAVSPDPSLGRYHQGYELFHHLLGDDLPQVVRVNRWPDVL
jgi:hypothetical protein